MVEALEAYEINRNLGLKNLNGNHNDGNGNGGNGNGHGRNGNGDGRGDRHRFQELTMMCTKMVPEEEDRMEKFIGENERRFDTNHRDNHRQQPPFKRRNTRGQNVARAYTASNNEKRDYRGTLPYCNRCKLHHEGQCTVKCHNCKRIRHLERNCRSIVAVATQGTPGTN
nr:reverse transcriptase domain-containing protein [Tanacetum cinerariifolium]